MLEGPSYGDRLREARKVAGLTQKGLAEKVKVSADTVSAWENDTHEPRPAERRKLARLLPQLANATTTPQNVRISSRGVGSTVAEKPGDGESVLLSLKGLDLNGAAQKIADAIKQDLLESEVDIALHHSPTELERSRALVWALKDLARWLHNHGYHVQHLFKVTDEMAGAIGLPMRKKEE